LAVVMVSVKEEALEFWVAVFPKGLAWLTPP
jgi:hypothetical protein